MRGLFVFVLLMSVASAQDKLTVHGTAAVAQEAAKASRLRGTGFVRYWLDGSRPSGAPQGHDGVV